MIKFFRHIRQKHIMENKTGKYVKYAIGEIILVVIGILIALSINNWNEHRKEQKQEVKVLKQLKTDLNENEEEIRVAIKRIEVNSFAMDSVLVNLNKQDYDTSFSIYMALIHRKSFFNNSNSGYKLIGNGMAKLISNDRLLNGILQLYEKDFVNIKSRQDLMNNKIEEKVYPLTNKLFRINTKISIKLKEFDEVASEVYNPLDFKALTINQEYINNLLQLNKTFKNRLSYLKITQKKLTEVLKLLDYELENN